MPQLQHNMWVTNARNEVLSIITGGVAPIPCISTSSWRRKRNLALCTERRDPLLIRRRTAAPSYRGSSPCRYERLEFLRCIACCDMKVSRKREGGRVTPRIEAGTLRRPGGLEARREDATDGAGHTGPGRCGVSSCMPMSEMVVAEYSMPTAVPKGRPSSQLGVEVRKDPSCNICGGERILEPGGENAPL
jgi:hypothetical protein